MSDERRFYEAPGEGKCRSAPAALRNREFIAEVLEEWLPRGGVVLEIASGTGEHAEYFAQRFPNVDWQPSDIHPDALSSIAARREACGLPNIRPPLSLDASSLDWPIHRADAVLSINMVHIAPWRAALGLLDASQRLLTAGAPLILYGPWLQRDVEPAASNLAFDADLKRRDEAWGLRTVEDFAEAASARALRLQETRAMPTNNLMLLLRRD